MIGAFMAARPIALLDPDTPIPDTGEMLRYALSRAALTTIFSVACVETGGNPGRFVSIMDVQGEGMSSPFEGKSVSVEAVVTLVVSDGSGFWIQDPVGDGEPKTSDGIYVGVEDGAPSVGERVRVRGVVRERSFGRSLARTELEATSVATIGRADSLPGALVLEDIPDSDVSSAISFWSARESMRVRFDDAVIVAPTNRFGEFVALLSSQAVAGSGFDERTSRLFVRGIDPDGQVDYNLERLIIDDETHARLSVRPGDRVRDFVGVVDYDFGTYRLQPETMTVERTARSSEPERVRSGLGPAPEASVTIVSLNVENLFDLVDDPDTEDESSTPTEKRLETKLAKLSLAIAEVLQAPEILLVQEVENETIVNQLARRTNRRLGGAASYQARSFAASDGRGIENAVLWDNRRVRLVDARLLAGADVDAAFGDASPSPGREPLVATFEIGTRLLITVNNHFKSKGGDDPLWGTRQPPVRRTERQRKAQARAVRSAVDRWLSADPEALIVVAGDLNDFPFAEPGEGPGHPVAIVEARSSPFPLANLSDRLGATASTYIYRGNSQILDYLMVSPALSDAVLGVEIVSVNATYPASWSSDAGSVHRFSDHDPVLARFSFP